MNPTQGRAAPHASVGTRARSIRRLWLGVNTLLFAALFTLLVRDFLHFLPHGANLLPELLAHLTAGTLIGACFLHRALQTNSLPTPKGLLHAAMAWGGLFVAQIVVFIAVLNGLF